MQSIVFNNKVFQPSKIICVGRNYVDHIHELNNEVPQSSVLFIKPNSSIHHSITLPDLGYDCHYEAELSFLIVDNRLIAVALGLDLTLRELQSELKSKGLPWEKAKAFNGSAVFSSFVLFDSIDTLSLELYQNGTLVQQASVEKMIRSPLKLLDEATPFFKPESGDILMTGTPKGVGICKKNDTFIGRVRSQNEILIEHEFIVGDEHE